MTRRVQGSVLNWAALNSLILQIWDCAVCFTELDPASFRVLFKGESFPLRPNAVGAESDKPLESLLDNACTSKDSTQKTYWVMIALMWGWVLL